METDQRRALLLPQEIARLKPLEAILIRPGLYPIRCRRIRYYRDRTFNRLLRSPPIVEPIEVTVRLDQGKGFEPIAADNPPPTPPASSGASPPPTAAKPTRAKPTRKREKANSIDAAEAAETDGGNVAPLPPRAQNQPGTTGDPEPPLPPMAPHQSDGLISAILGAEVDLSEFGLADGKAAVAAIVDAAPTVESLTRGKRRAL